MRTCDFPDCGRPHLAKGLCSGHRSQQRAGKELTVLRAIRRDFNPWARNAGGEKRCQDCVNWLVLDLFGKASNRKDGLQAICKPCQGWRHRLHKYGMTKEQFTELLERQEGRCPICTSEDPGATGWHIDHDHACCSHAGSCGKCVRALLCGTCNQGLGQFKDSPALLRSAARYLEHHTTTMEETS